MISVLSCASDSFEISSQSRNNQKKKEAAFSLGKADYKPRHLSILFHGFYLIKQFTLESFCVNPIFFWRISFLLGTTTWPNPQVHQHATSRWPSVCVSVRHFHQQDNNHTAAVGVVILTRQRWNHNISFEVEIETLLAIEHTIESSPGSAPAIVDGGVTARSKTSSHWNYRCHASVHAWYIDVGNAGPALAARLISIGHVRCGFSHIIVGIITHGETTFGTASTIQ